jgi:hypothetical protein
MLRTFGLVSGQISVAYHIDGHSSDKRAKLEVQWHFSESDLHRRMSAIGGKADMTRTGRYVG